MRDNDFPELKRILKRRAKSRVPYWIAAILFWVGVAMSVEHNMAATGTAPSLLPGVIMIVGAAIYFYARYLLK